MAFELWMNAPNPMVTLFKTLDVTSLVRISKKKKLKFNMLLDYCIGKAAVDIEEFYILYNSDLMLFNRDYLKYTAQVAETCENRDLTDSRVIGASAITNVEIDGAMGMNSGIFNNPFMIWGKYKRKMFKNTLAVSFQFHHTQMDGAHAGRFLENLQKEINNLIKGNPCFSAVSFYEKLAQGRA